MGTTALISSPYKLVWLLKYELLRDRLHGIWYSPCLQTDIIYVVLTTLATKM
jgi:hypothetical protein